MKKEDLYEIEPRELAEFAFGPTDTFWLCQANVDWHDEALSPLNLLVIDAMSGEVLYQSDPIKDLINFCSEEGSGGDPDRVAAAVAALQSGIDRLRAYEAERLKAQP